MPKFYVTTARTVDAYATEDVEAATPEEAARLSLQRCDHGDWGPHEPYWESADEPRVACVYDESWTVECIPEYRD